MKTRKLISIVLLLAMSFSSLHAYAIDFLDEDHCSVSEYVQEIEMPHDGNIAGDICNIHHDFHTVFLLPETYLPVTHTVATEVNIHVALTHDFQSYKNFLKPPITLS